jgi:hypothetical protein
MTVNLNLHFKVFNLTKSSFQTFDGHYFSLATIKKALHSAGGQTLSA